MKKAPSIARGAPVGLFQDEQDALKAVDEVAIRLEGEWGVGRLRMLAPPALRERFDSQRRKWHLSLQRGDAADLKLQSARMLAAWKAVEQAAIDSGATPAPEAWECTLADGSTMVIVREATDVGRVKAAGRKVQVWSLEEVARVVDAQPDVVRGCKATFRGSVLASVQAAQSGAPPKASSPDPDDPIPF